MGRIQAGEWCWAPHSHPLGSIAHLTQLSCSVQGVSIIIITIINITTSTTVFTEHLLYEGRVQAPKTAECHQISPLPLHSHTDTGNDSASTILHFLCCHMGVIISSCGIIVRIKCNESLAWRAEHTLHHGKHLLNGGITATSCQKLYKCFIF